MCRFDHGLGAEPAKAITIQREYGRLPQQRRPECLAMLSCPWRRCSLLNTCAFATFAGRAWGTKTDVHPARCIDRTAENLEPNNCLLSVKLESETGGVDLIGQRQIRQL